MSERLRTVWGLVVACAAAVFWAYDLAFLQPLAEPDKPWHDQWASNNTYWARDLRVAAIVAVVVGVVLVVRGAPLRSLAAVVGGTAWFVLDPRLDRIDLEGPWWALGLAVAACVPVLGAYLARPGTGRAGRATLLVAASVAAGCAPVVVSVIAHGDAPDQPLVAVAIVVVLIVAALGCALAAAPTLSPRRLLVATAVGAVGAGLSLVVYEVGVGTRGLAPIALIATILLTGVVALCRPRPGWEEALGYGAFALAVVIFYPIFLLVSMVITVYLLPFAATLTTEAGNPPVNSADADGIYTLCGIAIGLLVGCGLAAIMAVRRARLRDDVRPVAVA